MKMNRLLRLVVRFCALPHDIGNRNFVLCFTEVMNSMIPNILFITSLLDETLIDGRDIYETNEYYGAIYSQICILQDLLREYEVYIMRGEFEDEVDE